LTGQTSKGDRTAAASLLWIRGGGFWQDKNAHLQWLCDMLGATEVMPTATMNAVPFCLTLAKIAHAFSVAELGIDGFVPFLPGLIRGQELSNRAEYIGGGSGDESPSRALHELAFDNAVSAVRGIVAVRIRLLTPLGTPTYHVAAGQRK